MSALSKISVPIPPKLPKGAEKRTESRRVVHTKAIVIVRLLKPDAVNVPIQAFITDISSKGIGLHVSSHLNPGDEAELEIIDRAPGQKFKVKIIWSKKIPTTNKVIKLAPTPFRSGMQFQFANDEQKNIISQLAQSL